MWCERRRLLVNAGKSKMIRCSKNNDGNGIRVRLKQVLLNEIKILKKLSSHIEKTGHVKHYGKSRVKKGFILQGAQKSVMICRTLSMKAMRGRYERVVVKTVHYGAETEDGDGVV